MVFPRAVLDKTLVPQLDLQLEAHLVEFFFFSPLSGCGNQWFKLYSSHWARQVVAGLLCIIVFLPFTRLEDRPAPELIGLWSRVNSRAHTAWQLPSRLKAGRQAGRRGYCKTFPSQRPPPESILFLDRRTPRCGVGDFALRNLNLKEFLLLDMVYLCILMPVLRRGACET